MHHDTKSTFDGDAEAKRRYYEFLCDVAPEAARRLRSTLVPELDVQLQIERLHWLMDVAPEAVAKYRSQMSEAAKAKVEREQLVRLAKFSPEHEARLRWLQEQELQALSEGEPRQFASDDRLLERRAWDPAKHPRGGFPDNRGKFSPGWGAGAAADGSSSPFRLASTKKVNGRDSASNANRKPTVPPRPMLNDDGLEVAGTGPETTQSYREKVQKALEILDPKVARWWKSNSVGGQIRSRDKWFFQSNSNSWMENDTPVVEVHRTLTPGEAAQAIIDEVKGGLFADSIGAFYRQHRFAQSGNPEEFRKWQQDATAEAARQASILADLYVNGIATLTPTGDMVVTLGDLAENGPRWEQLPSIVPLLSLLPIGAVILKLGPREIKLPKALTKKLNLMAEKDRKAVLVAAAAAKTDDEAATIIKREVTQHLGDGQFHHPISRPVHKALEDHPILRGKYQPRDKRFEALAKDLGSHHGYQEWHQKLDAEVEQWLKANQEATEEMFEKYLRERYAKPDLQNRFPKGF